ncbi:superfamily I DNA/RNA helicase/RecB family exonuclease [Nocardioides luteus]|uniref:ATP-dependent helicase n=1 Tax=Nocardioides luteus TaxID=1844 RepID=UPI00166322BB|nr:ATP-dependent DNA helicase [Nocardioides luteus]MDR7311908.1 superfamily I DNA/RNA helicase/RecB family exonuclease [Nocardioides luteus]
MSVAYRLAPPPTAAGVPVLDEHQRSVVEHPGGPLLVLAGPGTGKTTTLVEAVVDRIENRGVRPDQLLALTFSRKAAEQLRDRVTARLGRTLSGTVSSTFHSFAYGLVRRFAPAELYAAPLTLLSAPEADVVLQELLADHPESVRWPDRFRMAVGTRGFAREVQTVTARARERGLDPDQLVALGQDEKIEEFVAAGWFLEQYLDVLGAQSAIDYPDLIMRGVIEAERHAAELRAEFSCVFVDEYQDTDPSQVALLQALAGDGRDLIVVGDPDQSIYGFRGADVNGILDFPAQFLTRERRHAPVVALGTTRRFGSRLLRASRSIAAGISVRGAIPAAAYETFRNPHPLAQDPGRAEVLTFDTDRAETEHIADLLRRAHLEDGIDWSDMAVLVRSGRNSIPQLRRSLTAAGVPVEVASDETPLVREPAAAVLLDALGVVVDADVDSELDERYVRPERCEELLTGPLGGLDATDVRALTRTLRAWFPDVAAHELVRRAVLDHTLLDEEEAADEERVLGRVRRLAALLAEARAALKDGAGAEQVLWTLWDGADWGRRLRAQVESGGPAARLAHRDLDAVVALFDTAAKIEGRQEFTSVETFLATLRAQEIPADTLADKGVRGSAVRLLTAHRSKGLEWGLVVVAHVQEGAWPDLRRRDSLLGPDRIAPALPDGRHGGLLPPLTRSAMLAEERRLFYVAATRARSRLVVTAVRSPDEDGDQPSRFINELGLREDQIRHRVGRPARPLSLAGLVAELRRTAADPGQPLALREAAARRLQKLAATEVRGKRIAPAADPSTWWGMRSPTYASAAVRPEDRPITLSASALEAILTCPAQWFLAREAGGAVTDSSSQGFGKVVHAIAEQLARGDLDAATVEDLMPFVDEVWGRLEFRTPWSAAREREAVRDVLARFLTWHRRPGARTVIGYEEQLTAKVTLPSGETVRLNGYADRLELDESGRVVVVDLKTGKYPPTAQEVKEHGQLGLYQLAVEHGAASALAPGAPSGGAELIQLRHGSEMPKVQVQAPEPPEIINQLEKAVATVRAEEFVARPGKQCDRCQFVALCPAQTSGSVLS